MRLVALRPGLLRADVQTADRAHGDQRAFAHAQRAHHFAGKIEVAGNVDEVDFGVLILQGRQRRRNGNLTANLLRIVVGRRGAVFYAALTINDACRVKKSFDQRGLAFAAVSQHGDIADVFSLIILHSVFPPVFSDQKIMCA